MNRKKLMYSILKEIESGNVPNHSNYELELLPWAEIMEIIDDFGYASGITISWYDDDPSYDEVVHSVDLASTSITKGGLEFLEKNIHWASTYKGVNNVIDWLNL